jgi:D-alanyl-D-alanine carboxypeptidase/D-alanyl-D-alanine-endopeptidase (penicillin-binding protein 4)
MPASNRKLFAASTVVACLGPDRQFATELWLDGDDVILKGDGDPSFGGRYYDTPSLAFEPFVHALQRRGIRRVRDVIADVSRFDRDTVPGSWKVGNLPDYYAAPVDAITYAENVASEVTTVEPGLFAARALREALTFAGIRVDGALRLNVAPRNWRERVASVPSPFVRQILTTVLKNSHNLYTEVLFKDLSPAPASYGESLAIERRFLTEEVGLADGEFRFVDGCGLSTDDLVTPAALVKMVRWMNDPARRALFLPLMAEAGGEGTLRRRAVSLGNRLHAKTGTINGVNALSGTIAMPDGRWRYFSIVLNHHLADGDDATRIIDAVVEAMAR